MPQQEKGARTGVTYAQLLGERFPGLDPRRFGSVDLVALCERRLAAIRDLADLPYGNKQSI